MANLVKSKVRPLYEIFIPKELVEALEALVPSRCPLEEESERAIWLYTGERRLVEKIRQAYETQNKNNERKN